MEEPTIVIRIPSKITIGEPQEFVIKIKAKDLEGKRVRVESGFSDPELIDKLEYCETREYEGGEEEIWHELDPDASFGPEDIFDLEDMRAKFRVTFKHVGKLKIDYTLYDAEAYETEQEEIVVASFDKEIFARPIGTDYMEVYELFLDSVTDERYALMSQEELMADLLPMLKRAIYYLCRIAKPTKYRALPGYILHDRDDEDYRFGDILSEHEKNCLAWAMVVCWAEQQLNSSRLIEQQYYDAGIKTYSPNETMRNLLTLHDSYYKKLRNMLTEYGYKTIDISQFGGNE